MHGGRRSEERLRRLVGRAGRDDAQHLRLRLGPPPREARADERPPPRDTGPAQQAGRHQGGRGPRRVEVFLQRRARLRRHQGAQVPALQLREVHVLLAQGAVEDVGVGAAKAPGAPEPGEGKDRPHDIQLERGEVRLEDPEEPAAGELADPPHRPLHEGRHPAAELRGDDVVEHLAAGLVEGGVDRLEPGAARRGGGDPEAREEPPEGEQVAGGEGEEDVDDAMPAEHGARGRHLAGEDEDVERPFEEAEEAEERRLGLVRPVGEVVEDVVVDRPDDAGEEGEEDQVVEQRTAAPPEDLAPDEPAQRGDRRRSGGGECDGGEPAHLTFPEADEEPRDEHPGAGEEDHVVDPGDRPDPPARQTPRDRPDDGPAADEGEEAPRLARGVDVARERPEDDEEEVLHLLDDDVDDRVREGEARQHEEPERDEHPREDEEEIGDEAGPRGPVHDRVDGEDEGEEDEGVEEVGRGQVRDAEALEEHRLGEVLVDDLAELEEGDGPDHQQEQRLLLPADLQDPLQRSAHSGAVVASARCGFTP